MKAIIVAHDINRLIGLNGTIPWNVPLDMKQFKETTQGHVVIMGRKTYESIGKLLPNRINIILTRGGLIDITGESEKTKGHVVTSLEEAFYIANDEYPYKNVFIIGGASLYKEALPYMDKLIITKLDKSIDVCDGDETTYFPDIDMNVWGVKHIESLVCTKSKYALTTTTYVRK